MRTIKFLLVAFAFSAFAVNVTACGDSESTATGTKTGATGTKTGN